MRRGGKRVYGKARRAAESRPRQLRSLKYMCSLETTTSILGLSTKRYAKTSAERLQTLESGVWREYTDLRTRYAPYKSEREYR